ncbi:MAG: O-methyltransferase [Ktedonobacteraceae bacterium]|nr:O-methyltransferase [Ktedonobacteraceae bacterium]
MAENDLELLEQQAKTRQEIENAIVGVFAPEDEGLRHALAAAKEAGLPEIQISPIQGKLLQLLAVACGARKILEIGSLAGYSGIWLARALPANGRFITLEIDAKHAEVVRSSYAHAGVAQCAEVRVGNALDLLPTLLSEAPFDLIFIDADKISYPEYLTWALRLTRTGSIIVADNCVRNGLALRAPEQLEDQDTVALAEYNKRVADNSHLLSLVLAMDDDYTDGFNIAVVLASKPSST